MKHLFQTALIFLLIVTVHAEESIKIAPENMLPNTDYSLDEIDLSLPPWRNGIDVSGIYQCDEGELLSIHQRNERIIIVNINRQLDFLEELLPTAMADESFRQKYEESSIEQFTFYSMGKMVISRLNTNNTISYSIPIIPVLSDSEEPYGEAYAAFTPLLPLGSITEAIQRDMSEIVIRFSYDLSPQRRTEGFNLFITIGSSSATFYPVNTIDCNQIV